MLLDQALVAEDGDAGNGVHGLLVHEADELRDVVNVDLMLAQERMLEGDGDAAIGVFDVEVDRITSYFAPVADNAKSVIAGGHDAGQVDRADFEVFGDGDGLLDDGRGENSGNDYVFVGFEDIGSMVSVRFPVDLADGFGELRGGQVRGLVQIPMREGGDALATLRGVYLGAGGGRGWQRRNVGGLDGRDAGRV